MLDRQSHTRRSPFSSVLESVGLLPSNKHITWLPLTSSRPFRLLILREKRLIRKGMPLTSIFVHSSSLCRERHERYNLVETCWTITSSNMQVYEQYFNAQTETVYYSRPEMLEVTAGTHILKVAVLQSFDFTHSPKLPAPSRPEGPS